MLGALQVPLGPAAHFVESAGRVLQDGSVVSCLPPSGCFHSSLHTGFKHTGFVSTTLSLNIERALCTHKYL